MKSERGNIPTDASVIKVIIKDFYKQWYTYNKMNILLQTYNLPELNQEAIDSLNRPMTNKKIESVIENFQTKKSKGLKAFMGMGEFYQIFLNS